ncbi:MAG: ABC transporter permease [Chloroflexi bacterium]|nr:ABC transporter permease [Chloroflexota bacterium]
MLSYIVRRLLWAPVVLLAVSLVTFTLGQYGPGDPVEVLLGRHTNPDVVARIRHERGLDRPFWRQYVDYIGKALHGDLGESFQYRGEPVGSLIARKIGVSAQLDLVALFLSLAIGIPMGLMAALKQGTWLDTALVSFSLIFYSLPVFLTAPFVILALSLALKLLPAAGWGGIFDTHIIMPALVLGLPGVAVWTRQMRASTLDVVGQDYVRTARAKGLLQRTILSRHIGRNALLPIFTLVGLSLGGLVEGAFITETLFGIPGIGRLGVESIFARDYPVIMALTLIVAVAFILANIFVDVGYTFLDPRIRYR